MNLQQIKIGQHKVHMVFPQLSVQRVTMTPFIWIKEGRIINFGGHLEKFGGQNPHNSKKQGGHGKPRVHEKTVMYIMCLSDMTLLNMARAESPLKTLLEKEMLVST